MENIAQGLLAIIPFILLFLGLTLTKIKSYMVTLIVFFLTSCFACLFWNSSITKVLSYSLEGILTAIVPIIWVIFAAVFTYFLGVETGAIDVIKKFLANITPDKNIQVVIIAFCLGGFLESVAGFGSAVAIPTAMMMSLGIKPLKAAVLALVANSVPVAFGALGIPVIVLSQITSLDLSLLTRYTALQLMPFAVFVPVALVLINNESARGIKKSIYESLFIGILFTCGQTITAFLLGPELVAVLGSLFSLSLFILYKNITQKEKRDYKGIFAAVLNYIILLILVLLTRLVFREFLSHPFLNIIITVGGHKVKIDYLTTPGTLLFISAVAGGLIQRVTLKKIGNLIITTFHKIKFSAFTICNIVALAKVMGYSGMITSVAGIIAYVSGGFYPFFAPFTGAIGTFVTGSDTSSNILLGELQKQTAVKIGADPAWIAAANTSGATAGKMISPQSISVASATVGIESEENQITRKTIVYCLVYTAILGIYVFVVNWFLKPAQQL